MLLRNPTTGIVACCARAASGRKAATPSTASTGMKSARLHGSHLPGEKKNLPQPWWQRGALRIAVESDRRGPKLC